MSYEEKRESGVAPKLAPFRIEPQFVGRVWGSRDLRPWYDRVAETGDPIGEVWLTGDECRVATGVHTGKTLGGLFAEMPEALLGAAAPQSGSPLLIKMLFAREKLSVQVHPDDRMAQKYGQPRGKTECWYVLEAQPGAQVACGLKAGVTLEKIKAGIHDGTLEESLNVLDVASGEMIYVDAGTVHAIWPGSVLLETQQNCDLTYRMYDYGRPRELHIEKSLEATRLTTRAGKIAPQMQADRTILLDAEYFCVERCLNVESGVRLQLAGKLSYLFAAAGAGLIRSTEAAGFEAVELPPRSIVAVPARVPEFAVEDLGGLDLMRISPRWP